jgi:hypothetical protein
LRDDLATECCAEAAHPDWSQCAVGVVLGALLRLVVTVTGDADGAGSPLKLPAVPGTPTSDGIHHIVKGQGFQLRIVQKGGPPLDPSKLHSESAEGVAKELYNWAKKAAGKLSTSWRTLYLVCKPGSTEPINRTLSGRIPEQYTSPVNRSAGLGVAFRGGRQLGDALLVAAADAELKLEPFELTYGTAHLNSLRRMFEDEIATALGIPAEQVLCGEFLPYGGRGAPRKRHLRRETVTLQFAFLSSELAKLARPREPPPIALPAAADEKYKVAKSEPQSPTSPQANLNSTRKSLALGALGTETSRNTLRATSGTLNLTGMVSRETSNANGDLTATRASLDKTLQATPALSNTLQEVGKARSTLLTLAQSAKPSPPVQAGKGMKKGMAKSTSEPTLALGAIGGRSPQAALAAALNKPLLAAGERSRRPGEDLPPDQLLKSLISVLSNNKHPIRKHADCFPVLARIVRGGVSAGPVIVVAKEDMIMSKSGKAFNAIDSLKSLLKAQRMDKHTETEIDADAFEKLSTMRSEILQIYNGPDGELLAAKKKLADLSAKDLMEKAEEYYSQPKALVAVLETIADKSQTDVDKCLRLRNHNAVERMVVMAQRFSSDRGVVYRCVSILTNLTFNDVGSIERLLEKKLAPDLINTLGTFFEDEPMQLCGCKLLRRLYIRAREGAHHGPRIITLGLGVDELHTFRGLDHIFGTMRRFKDNSDIQLECFSLLVSVGEMLYNNGMAKKTFEIVSLSMHRYSYRADILAQGVLIITRLGKGFLTQRPQGPKGMNEIVRAMARHRSQVELQRIGAKALFALCKEEDALSVCRNGCGIDAVLSAMSAHSKDPQVLQQGTRALEKLCPRALAKTIRICGDLALVLPPITWSTDPMDSMSGPPIFDVESSKETGHFSQTALDGLRDELSGVKKRTGDEVEEEDKGDRKGLAALTGYRSHGLREDLDAEDDFWAVAGTPKLNLPTSNNPQDVLQKDIAGLRKAGCDERALLAAGPTSDQVKALCEALMEGAGPKQYGPHDAEFLACVLGHFAWHSAAKAHEVITFGGAKALIAWLRWPKERQQSGTGSQQDDHLNFPMLRSCLSAVSSICRHDEECSFAVLSLDGASLALEYSGHLESGIRRAALRCLARLIPHASKRGLESQRISPERAWPNIVHDLRDASEAVRTAAGACALEATYGGWVSEASSAEEPTVPVDEFVDAVFSALEKAGQTESSSAGLPLLLALEHIVAGDEELLQRDVTRLQRLMVLLPVWFPVGTVSEAAAADRAAALVAAALLCVLSDRPNLLGATELEALLRHGGSSSAEPQFRDTCDIALGTVVARTTDAEMLAQLVRKRLEEAEASGERFLGLKALQEILRRIVQLLKMSTDQAMDTVLIELDRAEPLIPKNTKESYALLALLREARLIAKEGLNGGGDDGPFSESARTHTTSTSVAAANPALGQTSMLRQSGQLAPDPLGSTGALARGSTFTRTT